MVMTLFRKIIRFFLKSSFLDDFFLFLCLARAEWRENMVRFILPQLNFVGEKTLFFSMEWAFFERSGLNETKTGTKRNKFMKDRFIKVRTFAK